MSVYTASLISGKPFAYAFNCILYLSLLSIILALMIVITDDYWQDMLLQY